MKILTEPEVAEMLRCSPQAVKRLRLSGKLPYIPGRPVRIDEQDVLAYLEAAKVKAAAKAAPKAEMSAEQWALKAVLKPKRVPRRKP